MPEYDYIFVLLVYRNTSDPEEFIASLKNIKASYRVILVNSFYDRQSEEKAAKLCEKNGCDFISTENRGYGAGNNLGIAFAAEHYRYKFLIVANPDVEIGNFPADLMDYAGSPCICGPLIKTLTGKRQNPCMVINSPFREFWLRRFAIKPENKLPFYIAIGVNKIERNLFNLVFGRSVKRVYSLHGSFMIFSYEALRMLPQPFDPRMFLFREEDHVARCARRLHIRMIYNPHIDVLHKEDGSVKLDNEHLKAHTVDSLRVYFGIKESTSKTNE